MSTHGVAKNIDKKRKLGVYKSELQEPYTTDNGGEARLRSRTRKNNEGVDERKNPAHQKEVS
jgi:hypothetical protein